MSARHTVLGCPLCARLRHPSNARQARALAEHLAQHPLPTQKQASR